MALFGPSASHGSSRHLLEFRAGKMDKRGNMVYPDKRKGLVYVQQSEDGLMHFFWKDRTTGAIEDDLIVFPDEFEYKRVAQCTTGRVFVMKLGPTRLFFYWMQEPKEDKDEEICKKVNDLFSSPPSLAPSRGGSSALPGDLASLLGGGGGADLSRLLGGGAAIGGQEELMAQLLGQLGGSAGSPDIQSLLGGSGLTPTPSDLATSTSTTPAASRQQGGPTPSSRPSRASGAPSASARRTPSQQVTETQLLSVLRDVLPPGQTPTTVTVPQEEPVQLSDVIKPDAMLPILASPEIQALLIPLLPEGEDLLPKTEEELRNTIHSPQFKQALDLFSLALAGGELGPLLMQFGLSDAAVDAANQGDVLAFAQAMQGPDKPSEPEASESTTAPTSATSTTATAAETDDTDVPMTPVTDESKEDNKTDDDKMAD